MADTRLPCIDAETIEACVSVADKAVQQAGHGSPRFYTISGSHIYGFPSEVGGDVDLRGFHVAHDNQRVTIDGPKEQVIINQQGTTEGFERCSDIELVSYEIRKFGKLVAKMNFNVLEWLHEGEVAMNGVPLEIDALRKLTKDALPADVPRQYLGMAKSNYWRYLDESKGSYKPTAKKYLYILRGLLAADHIMNGGDIEPDIEVLASKGSEAKTGQGVREIIGTLVSMKRRAEDVVVNEGYRSAPEGLIQRKFNELEIVEIDCSSNYRQMKEEVDSWMRKVVL